MSHGKVRQEKNCLNCNAQLQGRYCHICGQENIEPKETVWHLISHFFQDITHFDGKFFNTLRLLIFRPGFLSSEYMAGRRASYLNPVRMYVFTSAFFFLIFFTVYNTEEKAHITDPIINGKTMKQVLRMDSASFAAFTIGVNITDNKPAVPMKLAEYEKYADSVFQSAGPRIAGITYKSREEYDSLLAAGKLKHNWLERLGMHKLLDIYKKYDYDNRRIVTAFTSSWVHSIPQVLFVSLPLLALLLKFLYFRRKKFYYVDHAIFSIQFYIFVFITLLFIFGLQQLNQSLHWWFINFTITLLYIGMFIYEYKAMRNFYQQRRAKTIIKFLLLNLMFFIVLTILFMAFAIFSFFKI